ncbi:acyltransferase family protein [Acinetobacter baumannii]|uniref:acyltransferase family protein n=1 Tax=Acinetobacter baumannii TaxID=470 RepID=UPI0038912A46
MRNLSIDYLKVTLAYFVVLLHLEFLYSYYPEIGFILVNGLFRLAVPLFFIITGYYFSKITNIEELKIWGKRIFIMYAIWTIFYIPFWFRHLEDLTTVLTGYFTLWYLISLLLGGIILYIFKNIKTYLLLTIAFGLYLIGYILQQTGNIHYFSGNYDQTLNYFPTYRNFIFFSFPMLAIGYIINKFQIDKKYKPSLYLVAFSIITVLLEAYINYKYINSHEPIDLLLSLIYTPALIFLYIKNFIINGKNKELANFSTAIFLIHPFIIGLSGFLKISYPVIFVLTFTSIAAYILTLINKRFKFLL